MTIDQIISELLAGKVVALPTDGVFGLFATYSAEGIQSIHTLKKQTSDQKMCVYTNDTDFLDISVYPKRLNNLPKFGTTYILKGTPYRSSTVHKSINQIVTKIGPLIGTFCHAENTTPITHWKHIPFDISILRESCITGIEPTIINLDTYSVINSGYTDPSSIDFLAYDGKITIDKYSINSPGLTNYPSFESLFQREYTKYFWYYINEYKHFDSIIESETYHGKLLNQYLKRLF